MQKVALLNFVTNRIRTGSKNLEQNKTVFFTDADDELLKAVCY